jgi:hypothetical protein
MGEGDRGDDILDIIRPVKTEEPSEVVINRLVV